MWEGDLWVAVRAARAGADIVYTGLSEVVDTEMKGAVNPVTQVDRASEEAIMSTIAHHFPQDRLLGEEGGGSDWREGRVWIVDPLDGTVNFVHHIPQASVSVALWEDGEPLLGVIIDIARDEEFVAVRGGGATLNGEPISVSGATRLEDSLILTGFPYDRRDYAPGYLRVVERLLVEARAIRVIGSAALDLAWIAAGRGDGYCEAGGPLGLRPWDMAAGALLVAEAGGTFSDDQGRDDQLEGAAFVASNGKIHEELRSIVADTLPEHLV